MNLILAIALLLLAGFLAFLVWLGFTLDEGDLLPPGWYILPSVLIGGLLFVGVLV